eukprot:scaffold1377_cov390-Prasinococcus_capsulatus_cf.AAC.11
MDRETKRSRGFGFVTFKTEEAVAKVIERGLVHSIEGKDVEIKKAEPRIAGQPGAYARAGGGGGGGYRGRRGGPRDDHSHGRDPYHYYGGGGGGGGGRGGRYDERYDDFYGGPRHRDDFFYYGGGRGGRGGFMDRYDDLHYADMPHGMMGAMGAMGGMMGMA